MSDFDPAARTMALKLEMNDPPTSIRIERHLVGLRDAVAADLGASHDHLSARIEKLEARHATVSSASPAPPSAARLDLIESEIIRIANHVGVTVTAFPAAVPPAPPFAARDRLVEEMAEAIRDVNRSGAWADLDKQARAALAVVEKAGWAPIPDVTDADAEEALLAYIEAFDSGTRGKDVVRAALVSHVERLRAGGTK